MQSITTHLTITSKMQDRIQKNKQKNNTMEKEKKEKKWGKL